MSNAEIEVRKEQQSWKWRRWVLLISGVVLMPYPYIMRYFHMFDMEIYTSPSVHYTQIIVPPLIDMLPFVGMFFLALSIGKWKGDPKVMLLLEIIEKERERSNQALQPTPFGRG